METPPNVSYRLRCVHFVCVCVMCHVLLCFVHCVWYRYVLSQAMIKRSIGRRHRKRFGNCTKLSNIGIKSWHQTGVSERLGAPLAAPWGVSGHLNGLQHPTAPKRHEPSDPKQACRRVVGRPLGRPSDTFLKPGGVIFMKKRRQKCVFVDFQYLLAAGVVFLDFWIDVSSMFGQKTPVKMMLVFKASRVFSNMANL